MKKNIIVIGLFIMILINGFLIYLLQQGKPPRPNFKARGRVETEIINKLELDEKQTTQFRTLAKEHRQSMDQLDRRQKDLLRSYFNQLNTSTNDTIASDDILAELELLESKKITTTYQHFEDIKDLCTQDQLVQFEQIMNHMLQILLNGQRKSPPPPRDF